jgi:hypothetical protein
MINKEAHCALTRNKNKKQEIKRREKNVCHLHVYNNKTQNKNL